MSEHEEELERFVVYLAGRLQEEGIRSDRTGGARRTRVLTPSSVITLAGSEGCLTIVIDL